MVDTSKIRPGMEVVGLFHGYVGIVDTIEEHGIRLAHEDLESGGEYHYIPLDWVKAVDETVHLDRAFDHAMRQWQTEPS